MVAGFTGEFVKSKDAVKPSNGELLVEQQRPSQMTWQQQNLLKKHMKKLR